MSEEKKDKSSLMDILFKKEGRVKQKGKSIAEQINWANKNKDKDKKKEDE